MKDFRLACNECRNFLYSYEIKETARLKREFDTVLILESISLFGHGLRI